MIGLLMFFLIFGALADVGRYIFGLVRSTKPKPPWGAILLLGLCSLPVLFGAFMDATTSTSAPSLTNRSVIMTSTPPHPTQTENPCFLGNEINRSMVGQEVCVYGIVTSHTEDTNNLLTKFSFGTVEQFFLVSTYAFAPQERQCLTEIGVVQLNTYQVPYIKIGDTVHYC